jgi:tetratricopeptide (TPR) repeat protein
MKVKYTFYLVVSRLILILILIFTSLQNSYCQTNIEKANEIALKAVELMDEGKINEAISKLEEAINLDPKNSNYYYEIAVGYYRLGQYKECLGILDALMKKKKPVGRYYQLIGNCLFKLNQPDEAILTYEEGLNKFPDAVYLMYELGLANLNKNKFSQAIIYFENGIKTDPTYSLNYYWAAKMYLNSNQGAWGIMYGEAFMNIERGTDRTEEMSKLIYNKYKTEIHFNHENNTVNLSNSTPIAFEDIRKYDLPFETRIFEPLLLKSLKGEKEITIASLYRIRERYIDYYFNEKFDLIYNQPVLNYQHKIKLLGHFEAYNYWLFLMGDDPEFRKWLSENEEKWEQFINWFQLNPMEITTSNFLHKENIMK